MSDPDPPPPEACTPITIASVPWQTFGHGERFGIRYQVLSEAAGANQITVCMEILEPGKQANQQHYHLLEEEHVLVLEGAMTVLLGDAEHAVKAGDYVCFPAGQKVGHALVNRNAAPCRYIVLGNPQPHDVIVYTETGRISVRLTGEGYRQSQTLGYWDGVVA